MPRDVADLWSFIVGLPDEKRTALLAHCAARTVNALRLPWDRKPRSLQTTDRLARLLALFVRFWLSVTPPLPDEDQAAAQVKGRKRYEGFIETLGRRFASGKTLMDEIPEDVWPRSTSPESD